MSHGPVLAVGSIQHHFLPLPASHLCTRLSTMRHAHYNLLCNPLCFRGSTALPGLIYTFKFQRSSVMVVVVRGNVTPAVVDSTGHSVCTIFHTIGTRHRALSRKHRKHSRGSTLTNCRGIWSLAMMRQAKYETCLRVHGVARLECGSRVADRLWWELEWRRPTTEKPNASWCW